MKVVGFLIEINNKFVLINFLVYVLIWDYCLFMLFI